MAPGTLEDLPHEVIWMVACELSNQTDLKSLCETSQRLHGIVLPRLYESITLLAKELSMADIVTKAELIPFAHLKYTKAITIRTTFHRRLGNRCLHHNVPELSDAAVLRSLDYDEETSDEYISKITDLNPFWEMMDTFDFVFSSLEEDKLRSFEWELGICIPDDVLCKGSEIISRQRCIEHISLITDPNCGSNLHTSFVVDLGELKRLKSLSWKGIFRYEDFRSLRKGIKSSGKTIESLTLDLIDWDRAERSWFSLAQTSNFENRRVPPKNFFASSTLKIKHGQEIDLLPALTKLSLSAVSFQFAAREMSYAMHMNRLSSLKLWNCPYYFDLLDTFTASRRMPILKTLELTASPDCLNDHDLHQEGKVARFLMAFQGLEHLFLSIPTPTDWQPILEGLLNHKSTLRRLVVHSRDWNDDLETYGAGPALNSSAHHLFEENKLKCLGFSGSEFGPVSIWANILRFKPKCSILHIRADGIDLEKPTFAIDDSDRRTWSDIWHPSGSPTLDEYGRPVRDSMEPIEAIAEQQSELASCPLNDFYPASIQGNVVEFAQQAFSANGLPALRVIAFGDFSYSGRYGMHNLLLCRDESGFSSNGHHFRALTTADHHLWGLVLNNLEMLSACPAESLMKAM